MTTIIEIYYQNPIYPPPPNCTYNKVISTYGFGCSGSGVLIDLISECDNTTVYGGYDVLGGSSLALDKNIPKIEIDILRRCGGLFDLENYFKGNRINSNMYILRFINTMEYFYSFEDLLIYNDKFMELTYEFIDRIADKIEVEDALAGDPAYKAQSINRKIYKNLSYPFLYDGIKRTRYSYKIKDLTLDEFYEEARIYLHKFLKTIKSKEFLFLDFIFADGTGDFERYNKYIENCKIIGVYRDPRDVYVEGIQTNEPWIPHDKIEFVKWYKSHEINKFININHPNFLLLRFEDFIYKYEETVSKALNFYGIDKSHHIAPKSQFRPEYSIKNTCLYKNWQDTESIEYIFDNLKEYCYEIYKN